jgi:hypothetical protein
MPEFRRLFGFLGAHLSERRIADLEFLVLTAGNRWTWRSAGQAVPERTMRSYQTLVLNPG